MMFVTGGTGFVGQKFVRRQLAAGKTIRALLRTERKPPFQHAQLTWIPGDLRDRSSLARGMEGAETVIHLAAVLSNPNEGVNQAVNVEGTRTLLQLCRTQGIKRFVFMSAAAVKFKQTNAYGRSKLKAEEIVVASGLDYAILRTPLIIGAGSEEWGRFVEYIRKIPMIVPVFGDGKAIKCPIYIDDVVDTLDAIIAQPRFGGRIWEVACRENVTLNELIDLVCVALGHHKYKMHIPSKLSFVLAGLMESLLGKKSPITRDIVRGINENVHFDVSPVLRDLRISPRSVQESIKACLTRT